MPSAWASQSTPEFKTVIIVDDDSESAPLWEICLSKELDFEDGIYQGPGPGLHELGVTAEQLDDPSTIVPRMPAAPRLIRRWEDIVEQGIYMRSEEDRDGARGVLMQTLRSLRRKAREEGTPYQLQTPSSLTPWEVAKQRNMEQHKCLLLPETAGTHSGLGDAKEVAVVRRSPSVELFPFVIETLRLRNDEQLKDYLRAIPENEIYDAGISIEQLNQDPGSFQPADPAGSGIGGYEELASGRVYTTVTVRPPEEDEWEFTCYRSDGWQSAWLSQHQEWAPAVSSRVADAAKLEARAAMQQQEAQPCAHLLLQQGNGGEQPEPIFYKEIVVIRDVDWLEAKEIKAETVDFRSELELKAYLNRIDAQGLYELVGCDPQELNWPHPDPYLRVVLSYEGLVHGRVYRAWWPEYGVGTHRSDRYGNMTWGRTYDDPVTITVLFPPRSKCLPVKKEFWRDSQAEFEKFLRSHNMTGLLEIGPDSRAYKSDPQLIAESQVITVFDYLQDGWYYMPAGDWPPDSSISGGSDVRPDSSDSDHRNFQADSSSSGESEQRAQGQGCSQSESSDGSSTLGTSDVQPDSSSSTTSELQPSNFSSGLSEQRAQGAEHMQGQLRDGRPDAGRDSAVPAGIHAPGTSLPMRLQRQASWLARQIGGQRPGYNVRTAAHIARPQPAVRVPMHRQPTWSVVKRSDVVPLRRV